MIADYAARVDGRILKSFTEVESGKIPVPTSAGRVVEQSDAVFTTGC